MNNRFLFLAVLLFGAHLSALPLFGAEDTAPEDISTTPPAVVGEAGKAVVDRVFGVKGNTEEIDYYAIEVSNHSPFNAGLRSALLPGWGQRFNRQPVKGAVLFAAVLLGAYGTVQTYGQSRDDYDTYEATGNRSDPTYDDYSRRRTQAALLGGATVALWAYSVFDAYRNAYNPLYGSDPAFQLALQDDGASLEWQRRF